MRNIDDLVEVDVSVMKNDIRIRAELSSSGQHEAGREREWLSRNHNICRKRGVESPLRKNKVCLVRRD